MRGGPQEFPPQLEVSQLAPWHSLEAGAGCLVTSQQAAPLSILVLATAASPHLSRVFLPSGRPECQLPQLLPILVN